MSREHYPEASPGGVVGDVRRLAVTISANSEDATMPSDDREPGQLTAKAADAFRKPEVSLG
jgi:hypothetical protein